MTGREGTRPVVLTAAVAVLLVTAVTGSAHGAPAAARITTASGVAGTEPAPRTYYDFRAHNPSDGFCEQKVFGRGRLVAEPVNVLFALTTFFLGVLGLFRAKRTSMAFQFLFGLLAAYGFFAAAYHATLMNGFYRMKDVAISLVQSFVIIMLFHSLYLYRVKRRGRDAGRGYRVFAAVMTLLFTAYPAAVHVAGESSADAWVAWLVFDLLWIPVIALLILIWRRRMTWPNTPPDARVFHLVWYAIAATVLAYASWVVDEFACNAGTRVLGYLSLHGWWHFFMGLSFYYLISLCRFFSAYEYGFNPILERIPATGPFRLSFVEWRSRRPPTLTVSRMRRDRAIY